MQLAAQSGSTVDGAFNWLMGPLGVKHGTEGQAVVSGAEVPQLAGVVLEALNTPAGFSLILRLEKPARHCAHDRVSGGRAGSCLGAVLSLWRGRRHGCRCSRSGLAEVAGRTVPRDIVKGARGAFPHRPVARSGVQKEGNI